MTLEELIEQLQVLLEQNEPTIQTNVGAVVQHTDADGYRTIKLIKVNNGY